MLWPTSANSCLAYYAGAYLRAQCPSSSSPEDRGRELSADVKLQYNTNGIKVTVYNECPCIFSLFAETFSVFVETFYFFICPQCVCKCLLKHFCHRCSHILCRDVSHLLFQSWRPLWQTVVDGSVDGVRIIL